MTLSRDERVYNFILFSSTLLVCKEKEDEVYDYILVKWQFVNHYDNITRKLPQAAQVHMLVLHWNQCNSVVLKTARQITLKWCNIEN